MNYASMENRKMADELYDKGMKIRREVLMPTSTARWRALMSLPRIFRITSRGSAGVRFGDGQAWIGDLAQS